MTQDVNSGTLILPESFSSTKEKTVGEASLELLKNGDDKQPVVDTAREMLKGYYDNLIDAALSGEKKYGKENPFYVCVQTRRERTMVNVIRNQFYTRQTRPSPAYDLALYWYDPKSERLEFVWCIPDKQSVQDLVASEAILPPDHERLVWFCKCFLAGTLV